MLKRVFAGLAGLLLMSRVAAAAPPAFPSLVEGYFQEHYRFHPTQATADGFHQWDDRLEDAGAASVHAEDAMLHRWLSRFQAAGHLTPDEAMDRDLLVHSIESQLLDIEVIRGWQKNPDQYSSGLSYSAFTLMSRSFAPKEDRLRALVSREQAMPAVLDAARQNLRHCPRVFTEIALEQLPDIISFFRDDVPKAFDGVGEEPLVEAFHDSNAQVLAALDRYQTWLQSDVLPHSDGDFRIGAATYARKLDYDEMVDVPLDRLLAIGMADMRANQRHYKEVARRLDPSQTPQAILARLTHQHPEPDKLLDTFRDTLGGLRDFIESHHILTIPSPVMPTLEETPPFDRALTMASMDTPGPFEKVAREAYFNVTLPEAGWTPKRVEQHMDGFNYGTITSTAIHEAFPGHYIQFLYLQRQPDKVRKLVQCSTCAEGWAHYTEQMMLDEGYGHGDLSLRLGQLQDALLRDARLVVGIQMHRGRMSIQQAIAFIHKEGYQSEANARVEALRGTSDPTYLYYTVGKLEILKLRADWYRRHPHATLQQFHDEFLRQGVIPIKLIRVRMLGREGSIL